MPYRFKLKTNTIKDLQGAYQPPIRVIKMKIDNTHDYIIPPELLEQFLSDMLSSKEGMERLKQLKGRFKVNPLQYINSIDFIVRSMEGGKSAFPEKSKLNEDLPEDE